MPFLPLLLGNWKIIALGLLIAAAVTYHFLSLSGARQEGRQEVWAKVEAQAQRQAQIASAASVAALEALQEVQTRNERIVADAIRKIQKDCPVDPAVIDALDRLRSGQGNDNQGGDSEDPSE